MGAVKPSSFSFLHPLPHKLPPVGVEVGATVGAAVGVEVGEDVEAVGAIVSDFLDFLDLDFFKERC